MTHAVPMMSIDNTYSEEDVRAFDQRVRKMLGDEPVCYVLEPKIDGVASSLRFEKGVLVLAATRGTGTTGDDITAQARTINSIPLRLHDDGKLPDVLEVRGEIFMANGDFQRINKQRSRGRVGSLQESAKSHHGNAQATRSENNRPAKAAVSFRTGLAK